MNAEQKNNNTNNTNNNTDGQGHLINERPGYSDVASGRATSPKLLHLEYNLQNTANALEFNELTMDSEEIEVEEDNVSLDKELEQELMDYEMETTLKGKESSKDAATEDDLLRRMAVYRDKLEKIHDQMMVTEDRETYQFLKEKINLTNSLISPLQKQYQALKEVQAAAVKAKPTSNNQSSISTKLVKRSIPLNQIPVFRIQSIDDTVVYHNKDNERTKNDNGNSYPSIEAFFNHFESVIRHYRPESSIEDEWPDNLHMSFSSCTDLAFSWYKKNIDKERNQLTWKQVKKLITERFDTPITNFMKGLRLIRLSPKYMETFANYVDRFTNLLDKIEDVHDDKRNVMIFFNGLPKSFRKFMIDKLNMITNNTSESKDPFPLTWKETAELLNQHKNMFNNELERIYSSYDSKTSYEQSVKLDKKANLSSDNDGKMKNKEDISTSSRNNSFGKKRSRGADDDHNRQKHKAFKHGPHGSNASRYAPQNVGKLCWHCKSEPYSSEHRSICPALNARNNNYPNRSIRRNDHGSDRNRNYNNSHGNHAPTYGESRR